MRSRVKRRTPGGVLAGNPNAVSPSFAPLPRIKNQADTLPEYWRVAARAFCDAWFTTNPLFHVQRDKAPCLGRIRFDAAGIGVSQLRPETILCVYVRMHDVLSFA